MNNTSYLDNSKASLSQVDNWVQLEELCHVRLCSLVDGRHEGVIQQHLKVLLVQIQHGEVATRLKNAEGLCEDVLRYPLGRLMRHQAERHQVLGVALHGGGLCCLVTNHILATLGRRLISSEDKVR